jgi:hypothetical protein
MYNKINNMDNFDLKKYLAEGKLEENNPEKIIYVIISRDQGLVGATTNPKKAEELVKEQEKFEEMSGGRPSVYIKETELFD